MADVILITTPGPFPEWNSGRAMRHFRRTFFLALIALCFVEYGFAGPFSMFPNVARLVSPDGRYEVRDVAPEYSAGELVGPGRSLWVTELTTGRSRKLCDYLGIAAVAWSEKDSILITQYVGKKTSRALMFAAGSSIEPVLIDATGLTRMVDVEMRSTLRENDHVFVEASRVEEGSFYFRAWGYGKHDPNGFRWNCEYRIEDGSVRCAMAGHSER